jgi:hypothetical protein
MVSVAAAISPGRPSALQRRLTTTVSRAVNRMTPAAGWRAHIEAVVTKLTPGRRNRTRAFALIAWIPDDRLVWPRGHTICTETMCASRARGVYDDGTHPLDAIEWTRDLTDLDIITLAGLVVVVVCVLAALVWAMIEGREAASKGSGTVSFERDPDENGVLIKFEPQVINKLRVLRRPGESYSDVILRLVELVARGDFNP